MPKVSIGMPVYNGEKYIIKALDSLLSQEFRDFELIISDNASTDRTRDICIEYALRDPRISYIRQDCNIGAISNFKYVLSKSKGEFFMWAAVDDCLGSPFYLNSLLSKFHDDVGYVFPDVTIIDEFGKEQKKNIMRAFKKSATRFSFVKNSLLLNSYQFYGLFRRSNLIKDFFYLEKCSNFRCFNEGLFVHAISVSRIGVFDSHACLLYRRHNDNFSSNIKAKKLIPAYAFYSFLSIMYFLGCSELSFYRKTQIIIIKIWIDSKYMAVLLAAMIRQSFFSWTYDKVGRKCF